MQLSTTIERVGFAPVKGTRHRAYDSVVLDAHGPIGDRGLCLVDTDAARVLRTVQNPSLIAVTARWDGTVLDVVLPGGEAATGAPTPTGEQVTCDYWGRPADLTLLEGPHAELLASYLGRPVRLAAAPRGQVVYGASVTIVSRASMRELASRLGRVEVAEQSARFRATVVVDARLPHGEDDWVGHEVALGDQARVRIRGRVPRCAVVDLDPVTGVKDAAVLKTLAGYRPRDASGDLFFGVDAEVTVPGTIRPGDLAGPTGPLRPESADPRR